MKNIILSKREKMALLATLFYTIIMSAGMYITKHIYNIDYGTPKMVTILIYFLPFAVGSSLIMYYLFFRGTAFKKPKMNWWLLEIAVAGVVVVFLQFYFGDYRGKDMALIWTIIGSTFMVGIGEEMLFFGLIFTAFREKRGLYVGILISASVFGFLHCTNMFAGAGLVSTLIQMVSAGVGGVVSAWIFYKTENLIPTMISHWFWDMVVLIDMDVPVSQVLNIGVLQSLFIAIAGILLIVISIRGVRKAV
ncbi:MAG: hypothetical protein CR982_04970 [Candidatus Cloacimonadota bacterium]|nr:MAG: hypothetical protein CR982_04970 [Candidatus Cloacimonadota bacterium]PIE78506.1 MAG: hypothetical protein CSA15_07375 [Candidatus Delongbacteria bacterium]